MCEAEISLSFMSMIETLFEWHAQRRSLILLIFVWFPLNNVSLKSVIFKVLMHRKRFLSKMERIVVKAFDQFCLVESRAVCSDRKWTVCMPIWDIEGGNIYCKSRINVCNLGEWRMIA